MNSNIRNGLTTALAGINERLEALQAELTELTTNKQTIQEMLARMEPENKQAQPRKQTLAPQKQPDEQNAKPAANKPATPEPAPEPTEKEAVKLVKRIERLLSTEKKAMRPIDIRKSLGLPHNPEFWEPIKRLIAESTSIEATGDNLHRKYQIKGLTSETA